MVSAIHRDAHRQVLVDERVQADDELELWVDGEHQRDVNASGITRNDVALVARSRRVAEADLRSVLVYWTILGRSVRCPERVDEKSVSGSGPRGCPWFC